jgi:hypothetical protein
LRKRLSGQLTQGARSLILTTADGDTWIVDADEVDPLLIGQQVIVEGVTATQNRLKADWIGAA